MVDVQYDFFYDAQIRRFLDQVVRAFSGFQYQTGWNGTTPPQLMIVPCRMATSNRQVANILRNNSENTLLSTPLITVWQTGLTLRDDSIQNPSHIDTRQVWEREVDPTTGKYTGNPGNKYTVQRMMPRPFTMEINVDIWTSNLNQKHQLAEQIFPIFYPFFDIQNSDNALDWSALTTAHIGDPTWSSRSLPIGNDDEIDVMTIPIKIPIWLSPPARVTKQVVIQQVVTDMDIAPASSDIQQVVTNLTADGAVPDIQTIISPGDYCIQVSNGIITLLGAGGTLTNTNGNTFSWFDLFNQLGTYHPATSQIHINLGSVLDDSSTTVVGVIQVNTAAPNQLVWTIDPDTLPTNTMLPVNAIIDPLTSYPGGVLPQATNGQRYLLTNDISNYGAWGTLSARTNDVIAYNNGAWTVVFSAASTTAQQFVLNIYTGRQLRWDGTQWSIAIDGEYSPGLWRVFL